MRIFVTGATGYIGGSVAQHLLEKGHRVVGLTRTKDGAAALRKRGIEPLLGALSDAEALSEGVEQTEAVINTAEANDRHAVEAMLPVLEGTDKPFIHTSGSGIVGDLAAGEPSARTFDEDTPFTPVPMMQGRFSIDRMVLDAASMQIRTVVIRPSLIYGQGLGMRRDSFQIPSLIVQAKESRVPRYVGRGLNVWSHVYLEDLADLYVLALERAPAGALYYAEHGEDALKTAVESIAPMLGLQGACEGLSIEQAVNTWGPRAHIALGSNSRVRADKARRELGWQPRGPTLLHDIEHGSYREIHRTN